MRYFRKVVRHNEQLPLEYPVQNARFLEDDDKWIIYLREELPKK